VTDTWWLSQYPLPPPSPHLEQRDVHALRVPIEAPNHHEAGGARGAAGAVPHSPQVPPWQAAGVDRHVLRLHARAQRLCVCVCVCV